MARFEENDLIDELLPQTHKLRKRQCRSEDNQAAKSAYKLEHDNAELRRARKRIQSCQIDC